MDVAFKYNLKFETAPFISNSKYNKTFSYLN